MSPATILSFGLPTKLNALSGQTGTHFGLPPQVSQTWGFLVSGLSVMAPNLQASMHQSHPLHLVWSTVIVPVSLD